MKTGNRVLVCTVTGGPPNWPYVNSIFCLRAPGEKMFRHLMGKQGVDEGHNRMIEWFLEETEYDWMLHLDSDAVVHPNTLIRLLSWNEPFVSALAFQRKPSFAPVVYRGIDESKEEGFWIRQVNMTLEWIQEHPGLIQLGQPVVLEPRPDDALYEVDRGGAHCLLTHRSVLEAIPPPWFVRSGSQVKRGSGSDFTFYKKAKEAGFRTYLDRSVVAGHLAQAVCVGAMDFIVWNNVTAWSPNGRPAGLSLMMTNKE